MGRVRGQCRYCSEVYPKLGDLIRHEAGHSTKTATVEVKVEVKEPQESQEIPIIKTEPEDADMPRVTGVATIDAQDGKVPQEEPKVKEEVMEHEDKVEDDEEESEEALVARLDNFDWNPHFEHDTEEGVFRCKRCESKLSGESTRSELASHHMIHTGEKPWSCPICPDLYRLRGLRDRHVAMVHPGFDLHPVAQGKRVPKINRRFQVLPNSPRVSGKTPNSGRRGRKPNKIVPAKRSKISGSFSTTDEEEMLTWMQNYDYSNDFNKLGSNNPNGRYQCKTCSAYLRFTSRAQLATHHFSHTGQKPFKCPICHQTFASLSNKTHHVKTHSATEQPDLSEEENPILTQWRAQKVSEDASFDKMRSFEPSGKFTRVEHEPPKILHRCNECSQVLTNSSKAQLAQHIFKHTGERPFRCHFCEKQSGWSALGNRDRHEETNHTNHEYYPLYLSFKGLKSQPGPSKSFQKSQKTVFAPAQKEARKNGTEPKVGKSAPGGAGVGDEKTFLAFMRNFDWTTDFEKIRTPDGKMKGYRCKQCTRLLKKNISRSEMAQHKMTHIGIRPFQCPHCPKAYCRVEQRNVHLANVHSREVIGGPSPKKIKLAEPGEILVDIDEVKVEEGEVTCSSTELSELKSTRKKGYTLKNLEERNDTESLILESMLNYNPSSDFRKLDAGYAQYECLQCQKTVIGKNPKLQVHIWTHQRKKPYTTFCCKKRAFYTAKRRDKHEKLHLAKLGIQQIIAKNAPKIVKRIAKKTPKASISTQNIPDGSQVPPESPSVITAASIAQKMSQDTAKITKTAPSSVKAAKKAPSSVKSASNVTKAPGKAPKSTKKVRKAPSEAPSSANSEQSELARAKIERDERESSIIAKLKAYNWEGDFERVGENFTCLTCQKSLKSNSRYTLKIHMMTHGTEKPFKCLYCPLAFIRYDKRKYHEATHKKGAPSSHWRSIKALESQQVELVEVKQPDLEQTPVEASPTPEIPNPIPNVNTTQIEPDPARAEYVKKVDAKISERVRNYEWRVDWIEHVGLYGRRTYECRTCSRVISARSGLLIHMFIHNKEAPYLCSFCDKRFRAKITRDLHQRVHKGDFRYPCQFCSKSFLTHLQKTEHETFHTGYLQYHCVKCGKRFRQRCAWTQHMALHAKNPRYMPRSLVFQPRKSLPVTKGHAQYDSTILASYTGQSPNQFKRAYVSLLRVEEDPNLAETYLAANVRQLERLGLVTKQEEYVSNAFNVEVLNEVKEEPVTHAELKAEPLENVQEAFENVQTFENVQETFETVRVTFENVETFTDLQTSVMCDEDASFLNGNQDILTLDDLDAGGVNGDNHPALDGLTHNELNDLYHGLFENYTPESNLFLEPLDGFEELQAPPKPPEITPEEAPLPILSPIPLPPSLPLMTTPVDHEIKVEEVPAVSRVVKRGRKVPKRRWKVTKRKSTAESVKKQRESRAPSRKKKTEKAVVKHVKKRARPTWKWSSYFKRHAQKGHKEFECLICGKRMAQGSMRGHYSIHQGKEPIPCRYCERSFRREDARTRHENAFHLGAKREFPCSFCPKILQTNHGLLDHENYHRGVMRYQCSICQEKFWRNSKYYKHLKKHREDGDEEEERSEVNRGEEIGEIGGILMEKVAVLRIKRLEEDIEVLERFPQILEALKRGVEVNEVIKVKEEVKDVQINGQNGLEVKLEVIKETENQNPNSPSMTNGNGKERPWNCEDCGKGFNQEILLQFHLKRFHPNGEIVKNQEIA